jgi:molybdenum cofactor cytidylyltransferase
VFVTGILLAAGASQRLGRPKQLLPFRGGTLLGASLQRARACGFDQLIVTIGGAATEVREQVDLSGTEVVESIDFSSGCSSSLRVAMDHVDGRAEGIVLLLGDQPDVHVEVVHALVDHAGHAPIGVCRYRDGFGHPFWFGRDAFADLRQLHGDKAIWKLLHSEAYPVVEQPVGAPVPVDVDTWEDYQTLLLEVAPQ